jgi:hypothetical protein
VATAGDLLQWHPHLHLIATDGGRGRDGTWHPVPEWDSLQLMRLFRERLLARLVERRAISKELVGKLLAWSCAPAWPRRARTRLTTRYCSRR